LSGSQQYGWQQFLKTLSVNNLMRYEHLIRLVRLVRGLEAGGIYSAAKLIKQRDEFGQVTILQQASYFSKHNYYFPQIEAIF
jgi:hypothetical protein